VTDIDTHGLGEVFDHHVGEEFVTKDVAATMATMTDHPVVVHLPTLAGGEGVDGVTRFYTDHFIGQWPDDVRSPGCRGPVTRSGSSTRC
jgi:carboxymethylenebutenolidase